MGQASSTHDNGAARARIAWRRAADELLIAAIFAADESEGCSAPAILTGSRAPDFARDRQTQRAGRLRSAA